MKIGIDARLYGTEHTGLGRYITKLIDNLSRFDKKNHYVIFAHPSHVLELTKKANRRFRVVSTTIPIYSFQEQLFLPFVFGREKLDLLHVPHFNAPILYFKDKVLTIHDLIKHKSIGKDTTTRNSFFYWFKHYCYRFLVSIVTRQAIAIITPTNYVKNDLVTKAHLRPQKIFVTYEAASGSIKDMSLSQTETKEVLGKYNLSQPFLVYTGNVYPHKNVDILIDAIAKHNQNKEVDLQLAIICARSVFWNRLKQKITDKKLEDYVKLLGFLDDKEVSRVYSLALALVHPSKMEGFGLTGIEAMGAGLPVIASSASCLPEIYGDAASFFDPDNLEELVRKIEEVIASSDLRQEMITKGYHQAKKYSWDRMVKETISVYNQSKKR